MVIAMIERIRQLVQAGLGPLDESEDGAIILLVLAAFLILIMVSMAMFEAGEASHEEIKTQNAADTAAYSQSVVKARSMNMLTYSNSAKRMLFSYFITHTTGMTALGASTSTYCSRCASSWGFDFYACYRCTIGGLQSVAELINLFANVWPTAQRTAEELDTLDDFQEYLVDITPWWAYAENLLRGRYNGATATTSWPPPEATLPDWANQVTSAVESFDDNFDTNLGANIPGHTDEFDELPVDQRDGGFGGFMDVMDYCLEFSWSLEHVIPAVEHVIESDGGGWDPSGISSDGQTVGYFMGANAAPEGTCISTMLMTLPMYSFDMDVSENAMDYRVDGGGFFPGAKDSNDWMQETSNITMAYRTSNRLRSGDDEDVFELVGGDHSENPIFQSGGTWSVARSEIVFGETFINNQLPGALSNFGELGSDALAGRMVATRGGPHMWTPRWTARLRPMYLPDEELGETIQGDDVGLGPVFVDSLPYIAASSQMSSVIDGTFDIQNSVADMFAMYANSGSFEADRLEGIER